MTDIFRAINQWELRHSLKEIVLSKAGLDNSEIHLTLTQSSEVGNINIENYTFEVDQGVMHVGIKPPKFESPREELKYNNRYGSP